MESDELTWVDSVPVRPARRKVITVGEYDWARAAPTDGEPSRLTARFWINSTEIVAVLVENTAAADGGTTKQMIEPPQPRLRVGGRSYLLYVEAPARSSTAPDADSRT